MLFKGYEFPQKSALRCPALQEYINVLSIATHLYFNLNDDEIKKIYINQYLV